MTDNTMPAPNSGGSPSFRNRYNSTIASASAALSFIQSHATAKNALIALIMLAAIGFVVRSVFQAVFYANLIFVAVRTLLGPSTMLSRGDFNLSSLTSNFSSLRFIALIAALATVVLDVLISPLSLVYFALNLPLVLIVMHDLVKPIAEAMPSKDKDTSYVKHIRSTLHQCTAAAYSDLAYACITAPLLHCTFLCGLVQLSQFTAIADLGAFNMLLGATQLAFLPHALSTLSVIGGISMLMAYSGFLSKAFSDFTSKFFNKTWLVNQFIDHHVPADGMQKNVQPELPLSPSWTRWVNLACRFFSQGANSTDHSTPDNQPGGAT